MTTVMAHACNYRDHRLQGEHRNALAITIMEQMPHNPDYIAAYESATRGLASDPNNRKLQHSAVLALARAGSTTFAEQEYRRFGLQNVTDNEDMMALGGRLAKDRFLQAIGRDPIVHARLSAKLYDSAFAATGGYYSGINAATMALMAGATHDTVAQKAKSLREHLPETKILSAEDLYFIEATRAEAYLLESDLMRAHRSLRIAVQHDPLNYTAHASTLRQFRMISDRLEQDAAWLSDFNPPKSMHFCGHIFGTDAAQPALSNDEIQQMREDMSDLIQKQDIGFGYGALAAGSDILFAEALLTEGAELHVILPVDIERFEAVSVTPYGGDMKARFDDCIRQATSVQIVTRRAPWPDAGANALAARVAMGKTVVRARHLSTQAVQCAVSDGLDGQSGTAQHIQDWKASKRETYLINYAQPRQTNSVFTTGFSQTTLSMRGDTKAPKVFSDAVDAASAALDDVWETGPDLTVALVAGLGSQCDTLKARLAALQAQALPGTVLADDTCAHLLALDPDEQFDIKYQGQVELGGDDKERIYAVSPHWPPRV